MKLAFSHTGRKFFFITLALEGRPKALSALVDETHRPRLTPLGEVVKAAFLAVHPVYPAATLSDFVIMPDHIHFILIVDYEAAPDFNPLWVSHTLIDAIENTWQAQKDRGQAPEPPAMVTALLAARDEARAIAGEITRLKRERGLDREAALVEIARQSPARAERFLANPRLAPILHRAGGLAASPRLDSTGVRGLAPGGSVLPRFDRRAYIEFAFTAPTLRTIRRYIKLNPARALWKAHHPDRFIRYPDIKTGLLARLPPRVWQAMGNVALLASPFLFHVRLTLKKTIAEHEAAICEIVEKARRGMIPVSGFISPGETEALRRLKAEPGARFIRMMPCALPPRYDPSAEDSRELAADRLLILSGFADTPAVPARDIRRHLAASHQFRANCLAMNDLAALLCSTAQSKV